MRFRVHFDDASHVDVEADSADGARAAAWKRRSETATSIRKVKLLKE